MRIKRRAGENDSAGFDLLAAIGPNSFSDNKNQNPKIQRTEEPKAEERRYDYSDLWFFGSSILSSYQTSIANSKSTPIRSATPLRTSSINSSTSRLLACGPTTM